MSERSLHYLQFCKFCEDNSHLDLDPRVHTHSGSIVEGGYISQEKARVAFQAFLYAIKIVGETR